MTASFCTRPTLHRGLITFLLAVVSPWVLAQDVELYERPNFAGTRLALDGAAADLAQYGMGNQASSVIVWRGQWEFCTQPQYRGACITVGPGRYDRLPAGLDNSLASLRPAGRGPVEPPRPPQPPQPPQPPFPPQPPRPDPGASARIVLYAGDFGGQSLQLTQAVSDLRSLAFNDSAAVIDVLAGLWELCADGGYSGACQRFQPGRHQLPPELRDRLSSLRPVDSLTPPGPGRPGGPGGPGRPGGPGGPGTGPWPGATSALVLYEHRDLKGRELALTSAASNLGALDFNDRASSVEIFRGRWQLCRHRDYRGDCVVLGPGRHNFDRTMNDEVSSLRPVYGRDDRSTLPERAVTLYERVELRGRALFVDGPVRNLRDQDFNDRAAAIEVHGGRWELCSSSDFRGSCSVFGPGWHRLPSSLAGELTSLRPR